MLLVGVSNLVISHEILCYRWKARGLWQKDDNYNAICVVIAYSKLGINQYGCQSCSWSAEQAKPFFPGTFPRLRIWSRETGSVVSSRVSLLSLHTQAESGAYSRVPLLLPAFRAGVDPYRQSPLGQSRVYRVTLLRTDRVSRQEFVRHRSRTSFNRSRSMSKNSLFTSSHAACLALIALQNPLSTEPFCWDVYGAVSTRWIPTSSTIGGGKGCNMFVPVLGGNGTKIAPTGDRFDQPPGQMR